MDRVGGQPQESGSRVRVQLGAEQAEQSETTDAGTSKTTDQLSTVSSQAQSSKNKPLSAEKIHEFIKMRHKLLRRLEKLEQREVSFDDEAKEQFYINNEIKIKNTILRIEKLLYDNGALTDIDDDLRAFHSKTSQTGLSLEDTGSELLNEKLMELFKNETRPVTLSFEELNGIMREVRTQEGNSSSIPDPELDSSAFLEKLEKVAFMVTRSHQKLISGQFLDSLDLYVPETERKQCSAIPEISSDLQELLTVDSTAFNIPDEVFLMEMRTAGRLEQDSQDTICCGEEIDITDECIFGIDEDEDENEDVSDENDEGEQLSSESDPSQVNPISTPATKPELLSKLSVDSTDCTRKGRKRVSESLDSPVKKKMDPDVSVEICWENIGFEVDEGKETVTPTSVDAGNAGVGDNDIEESNVLMTSDTRREGQTLSQVLRFEAKNDDEKKVRADFTDIIYIDD